MFCNIYIYIYMSYTLRICRIHTYTHVHTYIYIYGTYNIYIYIYTYNFIFIYIVIYSTIKFYKLCIYIHTLILITCFSLCLSGPCSLSPPVMQEAATPRPLPPPPHVFRQSGWTPRLSKAKARTKKPPVLDENGEPPRWKQRLIVCIPFVTST